MKRRRARIVPKVVFATTVTSVLPTACSSAEEGGSRRAPVQSDSGLDGASGGAGGTGGVRNTGGFSVFAAGFGGTGGRDDGNQIFLSSTIKFGDGTEADLTRVAAAIPSVVPH